MLFSVEKSHRGDSTEYTQYTIFKKTKIRSSVGACYSKTSMTRKYVRDMGSSR